MATTDITALIDYYVREKDLTRERVIQALEASFLTAYSKMVPGADRILNLHADINTQKGTVKIKADMTVVNDEELTDNFNEVKLSTARLIGSKTGKEYQPGDIITVNITPRTSAALPCRPRARPCSSASARRSRRCSRMSSATAWARW